MTSQAMTSIILTMNRELVFRNVKYLPVIMFSLLSIGLLLARMIYLGNGRFLFMTWNLFLAWLPLLWAELLRRGLQQRRWLSLANVLFTLLWLVFLPNSFYMITDFVHIKSSGYATVLYDSIMFMSFATVGVLLGCMSVRIVHKLLARRLNRNQTWGVLLGIFLLSGYAIYLGRYLGWNSWDLVVNPLYLLLDLSDRLTTTEGLRVGLGVSVLFFLFITTAYVAFCAAIKALRTR